MSIAQAAVGESSLAAQPTSTDSKKPPPKRQTVAQADSTLQPEPR
jgi:hypothetical protein